MNDKDRQARYEAERKKQIKRLGRNWLLHPQYKLNPMHIYRGSMIMDAVRDRALARGVVL